MHETEAAAPGFHALQTHLVGIYPKKTRLSFVSMGRDVHLSVPILQGWFWIRSEVFGFPALRSVFCPCLHLTRSGCGSELEKKEERWVLCVKAG